jgi:hypothetical protein
MAIHLQERSIEARRINEHEAMLFYKIKTCFVNELSDLPKIWLAQVVFGS